MFTRHYIKFSIREFVRIYGPENARHLINRRLENNIVSLTFYTTFSRFSRTKVNTFPSRIYQYVMDRHLSRTDAVVLFRTVPLVYIS